MGGRQFIDEFSRFSPRVRGQNADHSFSRQHSQPGAARRIRKQPSLLKCLTKPFQKKYIEELMVTLRENKED
jgi:hypothetical protein